MLAGIMEFLFFAEDVANHLLITNAGNYTNFPRHYNMNELIITRIAKGDKYFSVEWLQKLLSVVDSVRDKTYLMYHVETGLRVSDVVNTEVVHVDWQNLKTYTYDHKKDSWRYVYFPEHVKAQLKMWLKERELRGIKDKRLFPFDEKTANRIIKKWSLVIGHPNAKLIGTHWLRHTFIRLSRRVGRDIKAVQQNTGDTVKTIMEWYADLSSEDMRYQIDTKPIIPKEA